MKLFKHFGLGAQGDIHEQELHYAAGMPEEGKEAFPPGVDMRAKLRQLSNQTKAEVFQPLLAKRQTIV